MATGSQLERTPQTMPPLNERFGSSWMRARDRWNTLEPRQRQWGVVAGALILATLIAIIWFATRTDWRLLMTGLDTEDARSVSALLTQEQIPYQLGDDGMSIRVPAANLDKARILTASKGAMKSGRMGFELFDKPNWVGSEFDEQVNYQRALEGELEHTVGSLSDVSSARVHLVLPHDSLFREQERPAKASVVMKLKHRSLADGEADAIRKLVSSAVDGLSADRVVLVDADGVAQFGPKPANAEKLAAEQALEEKLLETLEPVTGVGNVRASVTLDYDPAAVEEMAENFDPDQTVTLSMQRTEQSSGPQAVAAGVPGTASNAPNSQALPVYPQQQTPPSTSKSESGTYGASKTMRHSVQGAGRVRRLTAAILVNDRLGAAGDKNKTAGWQPRSAEDVKNLTALAQAAVGFDSTRGDLVTVENISFQANSSPALARWEQVVERAESAPNLLRYGALLLGLLILIGFGIRPALARAKNPVAGKDAKSKGKKGDAKALSGGKGDAAGALAASLADEPREPTADDLERLRVQKVFEQVADHLRQEPNQSARLLQSWIHTD